MMLRIGIRANLMCLVWTKHCSESTPSLDAIPITPIKICSKRTHPQHPCLSAIKILNQPQNWYKSPIYPRLTNVVEPDPVCGIHLLLDVPGDDEVLSSSQGELIGGGSKGGAAV